MSSNKADGLWRLIHEGEPVKLRQATVHFANGRTREIAEISSFLVAEGVFEFIGAQQAILIPIAAVESIDIQEMG